MYAVFVPFYLSLVLVPMLTLWPLMKARTMRMIVISDVFNDLICVQF